MSITTSMRLFAQFGIDALVDLAKSNRLDRHHLWVAFKGAAKYVEALATGDVADETESQRRAVVCTLCPSRTLRNTGMDGTVAGYCGEMFVCDDAKRTCGCLVTLTVGLTTSPAGKTLLDSEYCPQFKWNAGGGRADAKEMT